MTGENFPRQPEQQPDPTEPADLAMEGILAEAMRLSAEPPPDDLAELEETMAKADDLADDPDALSRQPRELGLTEDPVKDYLRRIRGIEVLDPQQEVELAKQIEAGLLAAEKLKDSNLAAPLRAELEILVQNGECAKNHMLESNLRLVASIAKRFTGRGMEFLDLTQEGNMGLIRAMEKFDYTKGFKFSTYATWCIRQVMIRALVDQSRTIRIPVRMIEVIKIVNRTREELMTTHGRDPTLEEIAKELDMTPKAVMDAIGYSKSPISFSTPLGHDSDGDLGQLIFDADAADPELAAIQEEEQRLMPDRIEYLLEYLRKTDSKNPAVIRRKQREVIIFMGRMGRETGQVLSLGQIGEQIGVTSGRVRQLERALLCRLIHPSMRHMLPSPAWERAIKKKLRGNVAVPQEDQEEDASPDDDLQ